MKYNLSYGTSILAAILASISVSPLLAQAPLPSPAADEPSSGLQDIVVTARKRSENLQNVPIAVSAISGTLLANTGISAQVNLPRMTPGLTLNLGAGFSTPYIRGVGTTFATLGLESSVATYIDDQYLSRPVAGFFSFNDIERVEVLKGPQGTLYGRNAAAGAIRIITRDPTDKFEARGNLTYGSFNRTMVDGVLNTPIAENLNLRVSGSYDRRRSFIKDIDPNGGLGERQELLLRGKLKWEPSDKFTAKLTLDYARIRDPEQVAFVLGDRSAPTSVGLARGGTPSPGFYVTSSAYGPGSSEPRAITKSFGAQLRMDADLGAVTLSSITGYRWTQLAEQGEQDATSVPYSHFLFDETSRAFSQEYQAISKNDGPFKWIAGLYYYYEKGHNNYQSYGQTINDAFGVPYGPTVGTIAGNPDFVLLGQAKTEALAPYAEATYNFTDALSLTVGGRYTWEKKTVISNDNLVRGLGPEFSVFSERNTPYSFRQFTPKATLSFRPADRVLVYGTYSRGFKSGGFALPSTSQSTKVKPEILDSFEVGAKTQFGRLRINAAGFYYRFHDLQVQRPNDSGGLRLENAANAQLYGGEIESVFAATNQLEFGLGGSYLHSKYKDYIGTANVPAAGTPACAAAGGPVAPYPAACIGYVNAAGNFSGRQMTNAPKFSAFGRVQYRQPLADGKGNLLFNSLVSYTDQYFYNPEHSLREPGKTLVGASLAWTSDSERFSVTLFGDNLLGEKYHVYKTISVPSGIQTIPGAPATWGIKLGVAL